jgi:hypothetical protein
MQKKKQFKIGEYAVGGIIEVQINGKIIQIRALDYNTKEPVQTGSCVATDANAYSKVNEFLNELTSHYYAEKVKEWIEGCVELNSDPWPKM